MTGHATVLAGAGDDLVEIVRLVSQNRATDSFWIDGGDGSDDILLQTHGSVDGELVDYIIDVFDTGGPLDADSMVVIGTEKDDVFHFIACVPFLSSTHHTSAPASRCQQVLGVPGTAWRGDCPEEGEGGRPVWKPPSPAAQLQTRA